MAINPQYRNDVETILSHRHDQGADLWTTPDRRVIKGGPFSMLECMGYLRELGMDPADPVLQASADLLFSAWLEDGRFRVYPKGSIYPCQVAHAAQTLCRLGYSEDSRVQKTLEYLLSIQHGDGGLRCNKFFFGRGPETEHSNPHPTLVALDAFRFSAYANKEPALDRAVAFLLSHWDIRKPIGPCHYGMGTLFMQVEYPFRGYNLFLYVYVLSFYRYAREDRRFLEALGALQSKLSNGQVVVERVAPKLAGLRFCEKGKPSALATRRYHEILENLTA